MSGPCDDMLAEMCMDVMYVLRVETDRTVHCQSKGAATSSPGWRRLGDIAIDKPGEKRFSSGIRDSKGARTLEERLPRFRLRHVYRANGLATK